MKKGISISINFIIIAIVAIAVLIVILFIFGNKAQIFTDATSSKDCTCADYEKAKNGNCDEWKMLQMKEDYEKCDGDSLSEGQYVRCCVE
ncbi:MAG: hypothetical protein ACQESG_02820 [Nanobdellota archaeon]